MGKRTTSSSSFSNKNNKRIKEREQKTIKKLSISGHIPRNIHFLTRVASCRKGRHQKRLHRLLSEAGPEQLLCLVECCLNLLRGRVPAPKKRVLVRLQAQAPQIRAFSKARSADSARQHLQQQQVGGGIIPLATLLPIAISAILPVIAEKIIDKI